MRFRDRVAVTLAVRVSDRDRDSDARDGVRGLDGNALSVLEPDRGAVPLPLALAPRVWWLRVALPLAALDRVAALLDTVLEAVALAVPVTEGAALVLPLPLKDAAAVTVAVAVIVNEAVPLCVCDAVVEALTEAVRLLVAGAVRVPLLVRVALLVLVAAAVALPVPVADAVDAALGDTLAAAVALRVAVALLELVAAAKGVVLPVAAAVVDAVTAAVALPLPLGLGHTEAPAARAIAAVSAGSAAGEPAPSSHVGRHSCCKEWFLAVTVTTLTVPLARSTENSLCARPVAGSTPEAGASSQPLTPASVVCRTSRVARTAVNTASPAQATVACTDTPAAASAGALASVRYALSVHADRSETSAHCPPVHAATQASGGTICQPTRDPADDDDLMSPP